MLNKETLENLILKDMQTMEQIALENSTMPLVEVEKDVFIKTIHEDNYKQLKEGINFYQTNTEINEDMRSELIAVYEKRIQEILEIAKINVDSRVNIDGAWLLESKVEEYKEVLNVKNSVLALPKISQEDLNNMIAVFDAQLNNIIHESNKLSFVMPVSENELDSKSVLSNDFEKYMAMSTIIDILNSNKVKGIIKISFLGNEFDLSEFKQLITLFIEVDLVNYVKEVVKVIDNQPDIKKLIDTTKLDEYCVKHGIDKSSQPVTNIVDKVLDTLTIEEVKLNKQESAPEQTSKEFTTGFVQEVDEDRLSKSETSPSLEEMEPSIADFSAIEGELIKEAIAPVVKPSTSHSANSQEKATISHRVVKGVTDSKIIYQRGIVETVWLDFWRENANKVVKRHEGFVNFYHKKGIDSLNPAEKAMFEAAQKTAEKYTKKRDYYDNKKLDYNEKKQTLNKRKKVLEFGKRQVRNLGYQIRSLAGFGTAKRQIDDIYNRLIDPSSRMELMAEVEEINRYVDINQKDINKYIEAMDTSIFAEVGKMSRYKTGLLALDIEMMKAKYDAFRNKYDESFIKERDSKEGVRTI